MKPASAGDKSHCQWLSELVAEAKTIRKGSSEKAVLDIFEPSYREPNNTFYHLKKCDKISATIEWGIPDKRSSGPPPRSSSERVVVSVSPLHPTLLKSTFQAHSSDEKWLSQLTWDAYQLRSKKAATGADLLEKFQMDAGLNSIPATRYVHKNSPNFKIDVTFIPDKKADADPSHNVQKLRIQSMSAPYLDGAVCD